MEDANDIASVTKSLKPFDGRGSYREWPSDILIITYLRHRYIYKVMQGAFRLGLLAEVLYLPRLHPSLYSAMRTGTQRPNWGRSGAGRMLAIILVQTYEGESRGPGNGQAAWQALKHNYA